MEPSEDIKKPLKDWLADFHDDTGKISDLIRNLAFAGIGIIWIFQNKDLNHNIIPIQLIRPLKLVVLGLLLDVSQYVWRAINTRIFYHINETRFEKGKLTEEQIADVKFPGYIEWVTWGFFGAKIFVVALAYYYIYQFLLTRI